jgi:hypothetical protein
VFDIAVFRYACSLQRRWSIVSVIDRLTRIWSLTISLEFRSACFGVVLGRCTLKGSKRHYNVTMAIFKKSSKGGSYLFKLPIMGFGHLSVPLKLIEFMNLAL